MNGRTYKATRSRGLASWDYRAKTAVLLDNVHAVLAEYRDHLPLTARQIYYRLVGTYDLAKTEKAYANVLYVLNRGRRAGLIDFDAIRDDGTTMSAPRGFDGLPTFWDVVDSTAGAYRRERLAGQAVAVELWVEAAGMVPQAAQIAHDYGITVWSSGGFDSVTAKHDAALRFLNRDRPTVVLHVGDHDPSGCAVFDSAEDDLAHFVADYGKPGIVDFRRVAVTPEQIDRYGLPGAPVKATDNRGTWTGETVQVEALAPDQLATEIRQAVETVIDLEVLEATIATEATERASLIEAVRRFR